MPKEFSRQVRIADQIQRNLAQIIHINVADPRVGMVNINSVDVARDYSNAKIFVTFIHPSKDGLPEDGEKAGQKATEVLNNASGYLRSLLAKTLNSRTTPRLIFVLDSSTMRGQKLSHLIDQAVASDRDNQQS